MSGPPWDPQPAPVFAPPVPKRQPSEVWIADVLVPAGQAGILALPVAVLTFIGVAANQAGDLLARLGSSFAAGVAAAALVFLVWSFWTLRRRQALWFIERAIGRDLDGDGSTGKPGKPEPLVVELHQEDPHTPIQYLNCGVEVARMREVARLVLAGKGLTFAEMTGKDKPLSRAELEVLQAELVGLGHAQWKSEKAHSAGVELLPPTRAMFRAIARTTDAE